MLEVSDLRYRYPDGREALRGLTFQIAAGERVALLGPNGAGKSTLFLHLNGILGELDGTVRVDGLELRKQTAAQVRSKVGLVFQDPDDQLFCPTLWEDVAFGPSYQGLPEEEVRTRVRSALEAVGLASEAERPPTHLSGGQKKRAALATVLSMQPSLVALDEPTAGLDPRSRRNLLEVLGKLPGTLLVATHDLPMVEELCQRILILDEGRLVADGPTAAILGQDELLWRHGLKA